MEKGDRAEINKSILNNIVYSFSIKKKKKERKKLMKYPNKLLKF